MKNILLTVIVFGMVGCSDSSSKSVISLKCADDFFDIRLHE
jgi:hypothetical protein